MNSGCLDESRLHSAMETLWSSIEVVAPLATAPQLRFPGKYKSWSQFVSPVHEATEKKNSRRTASHGRGKGVITIAISCCVGRWTVHGVSP